MTSTRRPPIRKPATAAALQRGLGVVPETQVAAAADNGFDTDAAIAQLSREFDRILGEDVGVDPALREQLQEHFVTALRDAARKPAAFQVPARGEVEGTVRELQDTGALEDSDAGDLLRRFDGALQAFERRDSRVAIEFARRLKTDGEEVALEWYRAQTAGEGAFDTTAAQPTGRGDDHPLRNDIVNSRSRRPRGPPPTRR